MTDQNAQPRTISLNDVGQRYLRTIQQLSDLTAFNWAGTRTVSEQGYEEFAKGIPGLPSTPYRLTFEQARREAEVAWLKNTVSELVGLTYIFLEDIRKLAGLLTFNDAKAKGEGDLTALAAEVNRAGDEADLPSRLKHLKQAYGISTDLLPHLESLTNYARVLIQNGGLVSQGGRLTLRLRRLIPATKEGEQTRLQDFEHVWKAGDRAILARPDHASIFTTISLLVTSMLGEVQKLARDKQGQQEEEPDAQ